MSAILTAEVVTKRLNEKVDKEEGKGLSTVDYTQEDKDKVDSIDDLQTQVNDCFTSVSNGKELVASAITDKGITTASDATFQTMANNISSITTETTPTMSNISAGNIKHGVVVKVGNADNAAKYANVTGSFYNDGTTYTLSSTGTKIDMGASSSNRYITTSGLVKPSATQAAKTVTPSTSSQTAVSAGTYCSGAITVGAIPNQQAGGAKYATTSAQTLVTAPKYITSNITLGALSQSGLDTNNILRGKTITIKNGSANVWSVGGSNSVLTIKTFSGSGRTGTASWATQNNGGTHTFGYIDISNIGITPVYVFGFEYTSAALQCFIYNGSWWYTCPSEGGANYKALAPSTMGSVFSSSKIRIPIPNCTPSGYSIFICGY